MIDRVKSGNFSPGMPILAHATRRPNDVMSWFLCTVSRTATGNWPICRREGVWGVPRSAQRMRTPSIGDHLLVWIGGKGLVAECTADGPARTPRTDDDVPWAGGLERYRVVLPIRIDFETRDPVWLTFERGRNTETGLELYMLRRGMSELPEATAEILRARLRGQAAGIAATLDGCEEGRSR